MTTRRGTAAARRAAVLLLLFASAFLAPATGCRTVASAPRVLDGAQPSADALAHEFLDRLAADDLEGIKAMRITSQEFCSYVFPELPAAKTPNVKCDWVWNQATLKSMAGMKRMLDANQKRRYELVSIRFQGTESYASYRVLQKPVVTVKDETGATREVRLFGSILEMDGQYKLFSFVVD